MAIKPQKSDEAWMSLALREAVKGQGHTSPNPMVGAVLVRGNRMLASGYHHRAGFPHAEIEALKKVRSAKGATLYVTLEPCCHKEKRTPPCVAAIVAAGIKSVVVGCKDPNPQVAGRSIKILERHGIQVRTGVLASECQRLNKFYNHWIRKNTPWVILKAAISLDGRVALADGRSRWITGKISRRRVHQLRGRVDGILVGIGTVSADDPRLNARLGKTSSQPFRVVLDPALKISESAKMLKAGGRTSCCVVTSKAKSTSSKARRLEMQGAQILSCPLKKPGEFHLPTLLKKLGRLGITSLLVEGGPSVWTGFLRQRLVQQILLFISPKILGGDARPFLAPLNLKILPAKPTFHPVAAEILGQDFLLTLEAAQK